MKKTKNGLIRYEDLTKEAQKRAKNSLINFMKEEYTFRKVTNENSEASYKFLIDDSCKATEEEIIEICNDYKCEFLESGAFMQ